MKAVIAPRGVALLPAVGALAGCASGISIGASVPVGGHGGSEASRCSDAASPTTDPHTWGKYWTPNARARAAIRQHSVMPPQPQVSGWMMSTARWRISSRAPKEVYSTSPPLMGMLIRAFTWR